MQWFIDINGVPIPVKTIGSIVSDGLCLHVAGIMLQNFQSKPDINRAHDLLLKASEVSLVDVEDDFGVRISIPIKDIGSIKSYALDGVFTIPVPLGTLTFKDEAKAQQVCYTLTNAKMVHEVGERFSFEVDDEYVIVGSE
jgi:hypothetical protein